MAKTMPALKRRSPAPRVITRQATPWRGQGCKYLVTTGEPPYCRICRSKGLGEEPA